MATRHLRRGERGQNMAELGIVVVLLVTLVMGIIEFGRAWMVANMITHAARDGARAAATFSNRNAACAITSTTAIEDRVRTEISNVMSTATISAINVTQTVSGGIPIVRVQVLGTVPYIFNIVGSSFPVSRTVSFRDEGC